MHKIDVYIEKKFEGSFANGKGTYAIMLELVDEKDVPHTRCHFGGYIDTTNNRMDIFAIIHALKCIKEPCDIEIHTASPYVAGAINSEFVQKWKRAGWKTGKDATKNADLWEQYLGLSKQHLVTVVVEKHNTYSGVMLTDMKKKEINYITDYRREAYEDY